MSDDLYAKPWLYSYGTLLIEGELFRARKNRITRKVKCYMHYKWRELGAEYEQFATDFEPFDHAR